MFRQNNKYNEVTSFEDSKGHPLTFKTEIRWNIFPYISYNC